MVRNSSKPPSPTLAPLPRFSRASVPSRIRGHILAKKQNGAFEPPIHKHTLYNDKADNATIGYGTLVHYGKVGTDKKAEEKY